MVEAIVEKLDVKNTLFTELDRICAVDTILATNTSSISITRLAAMTGRAGKVIGMHFMNPVPVMKLVEIIRGLATDQETYDTVERVAKTMGKNNKEKAKIIAGPTAVKMPIENKKEKTPGKTWEIALEESRFKVTIEDKAKTTIAKTLEKVEKMPPAYRRCLEVVSEEGKLGLSVYDSLRGRATGQGTQHFLRIIPRAPVRTLIHEAGHVLEQRARDTDENILWKNGVAKTHDNISVSNYGNGPIHEDQAEFARIYAICLGNTPADQARLRAASPYRYALWEQMLVLSKAMDAQEAAPAPNVDFDAELEKIIERNKQMKPKIEKLNENIKTAQAAMNKTAVGDNP